MLGLTPEEQPFYNILIAELSGSEVITESQVENIKAVVRFLVEMLDEATQIVDFFDKWDEQRRIKRDIRRQIMANFDESLVAQITDKFMDLARVRFR